MTLSKTTISAAMILMASFMVATTSPVQARGDFLVLATSLCEYTKIDDRKEIRKSLKKAGVKLRRIYDDIKCNDQSLYEFAKANNSNEVMAYYEKKVKKLI